MRSLFTVSYATYIILSGVIFTFLVPPLQKADEVAHFQRTLAVYKLQLNCQQVHNNFISIPVSYRDVVENKKLRLLPIDRGLKVDTKTYLQYFRAPFNKTEKKLVVDNVCQFPILPYIPQAITLKAAELLHLNGYISFMIGRGVMFLICLFWFAYLLKIATPATKPFLLITFGLPMTLHQLGIYSYDAICIMFSLTVFTAVTSLIKKSSAKLWALLYLSLLGLILSRTSGFEFLLLTPLLILTQKNRFSILASIVALLTIYGYTKVGAYHSYVSQPLGLHVNPPVQLQYLIHNPLQIPLIIFHTTIHSTGFYLQSLIGIFGWLEYGIIPKVGYYIIGFLCLYETARVVLPRGLTFRGWRMWTLWLISLGTYLYLMLVFYIVWAPVGSPISDGIQGRYFLIIIPFLLWSISIAYQRYQKKIKLNPLPEFVWPVAASFLSASLAWSVYGRYF